MAVKRRRTRNERMQRKAAGLAPPEELHAHERGGPHPLTNSGAASAGNGRGGAADGAIIVDTAKLNLPKGLVAEEEETERRILGLEPVVVVILAVALAFIAFVAYLISRTE